jgi:hypothetical protein
MHSRIKVNNTSDTTSSDDAMASLGHPSFGVIHLGALAREIAARITDDALLDAEDIAALLKVEPRYVRDNYALTKGFPAAIRLVNISGGKGHPRWRRCEIMKWINDHSNGRAPGRSGRPRNKPARIVY